MPTVSPLSIRPMAQPSESAAVAAMMAASEPWRTLRRDATVLQGAIEDPLREAYAAHDDHGLAGALVLCLVGPFAGYIQTVFVASDRRGTGIGARLVDFAEDRIFQSSPNAFLCVSAFNAGARRLYERLGYQYVGELPDYLVVGQSELLYRKSRGSWTDFVPPPPRAP